MLLWFVAINPNPNPREGTERRGLLSAPYPNSEPEGESEGEKGEMGTDENLGWYEPLTENGPKLAIEAFWAEYDQVCYAHGKMVASHMGLATRRLNSRLLLERLTILHERRLEMGKLKTDAATY